jgi:septum formation protein
MGKPRDAADARMMLMALRGRDHHVLTAVSVLDSASGIQRTIVNDTVVTMRLYTNDEIEVYIATGDPFDKAGGYAIQHPLFRPVEAIDGCFAGVMGLPLGDLRTLLAGFGVVVTAALSPICRAHGAACCCQAANLARVG